MDLQLQRCNHRSPFRSKLELQHRFYDGWTGHRSEDETSIPPKPTKKQILSQSSTLDEKASDAPLIHSRKLLPIQPDRSAARQHIPQRAPSPRSVPPPLFSTLPEQRFSRPIGFEDMLNPTSENKVSANGRQHDGEETDSPRTAPMAATPSLPPTFLRKDSLGDGPLPSISPALMETYPLPLPQSLTPGSPTSYGSGLITTGLSSATANTRQPSFVLSREHASALAGPLLPSEPARAPSMPPAAHTSSPPPRRTSPHLARKCSTRHHWRLRTRTIIK